MSAEVYAVRQRVTTWITTLTPSSDYRQETTDAWLESSTPLVPEFDPDPTGHLRFFVDDRRLESPSAADYLGIRARGVLAVRFLARMRPMDRIADWDRAAKAGAALWRHLLAHEAPGSEDFTLTHPGGGPLFERQPMGDWLVCTLRLVAIYQTPAL